MEKDIVVLFLASPDRGLGAVVKVDTGECVESRFALVVVANNPIV